ncbi:MAG: divalent-cation tolerance protein CutA [Chthoniobacteraceae bacterium]
MSARVLLVFATFPDLESARRIGNQLVKEELAACVNLVPQIESIYRWKGTLERSAETLALIKTTAEAYAVLEKRLHELHPYDVPEIIAVDLQAGLPAYLDWVRESVDFK